MSAKPSKEQLDATVTHVVATLPDSLRLRKIVLDTILALVPAGYEHRTDLVKMLEALRVHDDAQLKFSLGDNEQDGEKR